MNRLELKEKTKKMANTDDLAILLSEIENEKYGIVKHKITKAQLLYFCNSRVFPNRYKTFKIKKKSGGTRVINSPCRQLKVILERVNELLKSVYEPGVSAMGFTEGRCIVDNANMHIGQNYVFNIDLENFFPFIPQARVWARLKATPFCFPQEIANVIAGLCCNLNEDKTQNVLPQGAPTSPLITNAICDRLDMLMRGVAKRFGLHYSRYADDMTFSSMHNVYQEGSAFRNEIARIIADQGFKMNDKKTRLLKKGDRQEVTGLVVNEKANVTRKYIRDLRCILHIWETQGYAKAYSYFYPKYKHEKGYIKKGEPVMENVIDGKLNYLSMVKGTNNECYMKLRQRYNALQPVVYADNETEKGKNFVFVKSYPLQDFEQYFQTNVSLTVNFDKKRKILVAQCILANMDKEIKMSKKTQEVLCPDINAKTVGEIIESPELYRCFVTLCINADKKGNENGKNYWFLTHDEPKRSKCLNLQNAKIDVDKLLDIWDKLGIEEAAHQFHIAVTEDEPLKSVEELQNHVTKGNKDKNVKTNIVPKDSVNFTAEDLGIDTKDVEGSIKDWLNFEPTSDDQPVMTIDF